MPPSRVEALRRRVHVNEGRPEQPGRGREATAPGDFPPKGGAPWEQEIGVRLRALLGAHMHARHFGKGECLWREGETPGLLVAIRSGRVKTYRVLPTGGTVTVFIFLPGDVFGFLPLLDGGPYPASAEAVEPVEADVMPRSVFQQILAAEPALAIELVGLLGHRLRQAFDVIRSVSIPGARSRVASALLALVPDPRPPGARTRVRLPVSAHEFAGALGIAPETLSRAISSLARGGVLRRFRPGRLEILDLPALERAARSPLE
jgi:CRP-like cAMP-binding protein